MKLKIALYALFSLSMCYAKSPSPTNYSRRHNKKLTKRTSKNKKSTKLFKNLSTLAVLIGGILAYKKIASPKVGDKQIIVTNIHDKKIELKQIMRPKVEGKRVKGPKLDAWEIELNKYLDKFFKRYKTKVSELKEKYDTKLQNAETSEKRQQWDMKCRKEVMKLKFTYLSKLEEEHQAKKINFDTPSPAQVQEAENRARKELQRHTQKHTFKNMELTYEHTKSSLQRETSDVKVIKEQIDQQLRQTIKQMDNCPNNESQHFEDLSSHTKKLADLRCKLSSAKGLDKLKNEPTTLEELNVLYEERSSIQDKMYYMTSKIILLQSLCQEINEE